MVRVGHDPPPQGCIVKKKDEIVGAIFPLGGLAAAQYSPKFEKSYRLVSSPLTRGLSCSPVLA